MAERVIDPDEVAWISPLLGTTHPYPARKTCPTCGDEFVAGSSMGVYCSPACRQKAYRIREGRRQGFAQ